MKILASGASMIVLSIGAFADKEFYGQVKETAAVHGTRCTLHPVQWEVLMCCGPYPYGTRQRQASGPKRTSILEGNPAFEERLMEDTGEPRIPW